MIIRWQAANMARWRKLFHPAILHLRTNSAETILAQGRYGILISSCPYPPLFSPIMGPGDRTGASVSESTVSRT